MYPCLAIVGPTASGKTSLSLQLAEKKNGEIISVDSRQVYRDLRVGTAQPVDTRGIPHHLVNFLDPRDSFSAADFVRLARPLIRDIRARGKTPILVGGTGFYFRALTEGLAPMPPADDAIRQRLRQDAETRGRPALHARLARVDPEAAKKIPANNIQRVIRALEVFELTGKPISQWHQEHKSIPSPPASPGPLPLGEGRAGRKADSTGERSIQLETIGLDPGREELQRRIEKRSAWMLENGMIEETRALLKQGVPENCPGLTGLGYPRVVAYLKGTLSRESLLTLIIQDTRQYAKRQRTWFRHQMEVSWKK